MTITRSDALNDALDRLEGYGYLDAPGFASHGPMGAETLSTLGHDELVGRWVETYKARHEPLDTPPATEPIDPRDESSWVPALGDMGRVSDWATLFGRELRTASWPDVVGRWVPRLLPGYAGALTHGLIRTAHAVRALPAEGPPSALQLDELAKGLAFWAAAFKALPGRPRLDGPLPLPEAIARLPRPRDGWSMIEAGTFGRIGELHRFPAAVEALGPPASLDGALGDLTAAACRTVLSTSGPVAIGLVHAVTPVAAVRTLQPHLPGVTIDAVYAQLWHVNAAIVCGFTSPQATDPPPADDPADPPAPSELLARAVEHRDTHVLKFTEACLREHARSPDPIYLRAAGHVLAQLPPW
ncbi:MAG TPA: hypothetical protein VFZ68_15055 [Acidimicrobiales bacterium]